ncbi:XRE family transcriptional regulator [Paraclostridium bifermentans]|uniref:XRE family transcriptional regulator n=1 Tax=Paraclostridium bifermentans TaxID=1490 RepID=A0A5P3XDY0_PARBF|nr:helix-turn-helix transcriptional regulator [Paraclostridium bifermentans]QEZ68455.1 XRE family transcriptional regulator [Paraclostridium bifermentans]
MENIGNKIKEARKKKGLTQSELAEKIGLTKHAIAKYEQGQREPNLTTLTKIIDELDLDFWTVCPNINAEIEAAKPYEEGIEFANEVCHRVNRKKLVKEWLEITPKEEVIYEVIKECLDLEVSKRLMGIEDKAYAKKYGELDQSELFKPYFYFNELRESIYKNMVREVSNTIELNIKAAEKIIKEY